MNKSNINLMTGVIAAVLFVLSMVVLGTADAGNGNRLGTAGTGNTHAADQNHWNNPNNSIGNCSKDGKFCWNITFGNDQNHWGFPIEY